MICKKKTGNWRKGLRCGHEYPSIEQVKMIAMQGRTDEVRPTFIQRAGISRYAQVVIQRRWLI